MSQDAYIIMFDRLDDSRRSMVQAFIKRVCKDWWHQFLDADIWIVKSDESAEWWKERLAVLSFDQSTLLVFRLPRTPDRSWAGIGLKSKWEWFTENYAQPDGTPPVIGVPPAYDYGEEPF